MKRAELSVLIPAAGASERLGQAKQLVKYKGKSLLQNAVVSAQSIQPREIIVVTGADSKAVMDAVQQASVRYLHNPHWATGMGGSIALGAAGVNPKSTGLLILLCDQWRIRAKDLHRLAETWRSDPQRIVVAQAEGHYMPPVIFPSKYFSQLSQLKGDQGARSLLKTYSDQLTPVLVKNAAFDLDTQAQLEEMDSQEIGLE